MKIVVIDGQGGRLGGLIVENIVRAELECDLYAIGTNSTATAAMLRAGAKYGATGENPVAVACRDADIIVGPVGIVIADSLLGEITPAIAASVGQSRAHKVLLPLNSYSSNCRNIIVGAQAMPISELAHEALAQIKLLCTDIPAAK